MIIAAVTTAATATVNLSPILDPLVQVGGLVLTGLAGWASWKVSQFAHTAWQSALLNRVLGAVDRGIAYGTQKAQTVADANANVDVGDATKAAAVNYVVTKMPGTLKALGIDVTSQTGQQHVADLVLAKLPTK